MVLGGARHGWLRVAAPLFLISTAQHMEISGSVDPWLGAAAMVAAGVGWGLVLAVLAA